MEGSAAWHEPSSDAQPQNVEIDIDTVVSIGLAVGVVFGLIGLGLWILMAIMNDRGKAWARIVATVLGGLAVVTTPFSLLQDTTTIVHVLLGLVNVVLAITIVVLLWLPPTSAYFKAQSAKPLPY